MFLNKFGAPVVVNSSQGDEDVEDLRFAPLLLSDSAAMMHCKMPANWEGCLYVSAPTLEHMKQVLNQQEALPVNICVLTENLASKVKVCHDTDSEVELTMIPVSSKSPNEIMFLIKDQYTTRLLTERLSDCFDAFLSNKSLREAILNIVDVLYIDDTVYLSEEEVIPVDVIYPTEFQLLSLINLVRPRKVVGTIGTQLPERLKMLCQSVDFYSGGTD